MTEKQRRRAQRVRELNGGEAAYRRQDEVMRRLQEAIAYWRQRADEARRAKPT